MRNGTLRGMVATEAGKSVVLWAFVALPAALFVWLFSTFCDVQVSTAILSSSLTIDWVHPITLLGLSISITRTFLQLISLRDIDREAYAKPVLVATFLLGSASNFAGIFFAGGGFSFSEPVLVLVKIMGMMVIAPLIEIIPELVAPRAWELVREYLGGSSPLPISDQVGQARSAAGDRVDALQRAMQREFVDEGAGNGGGKKIPTASWQECPRCRAVVGGTLPSCPRCKATLPAPVVVI